jgi:hypothetical protein
MWGTQRDGFENVLMVGFAAVVLLAVFGIACSVYDSRTGTTSMTTGVVIDKEHEIKTTDGSTSHYYYFMVKTQDEQTHRALTDEVTYRRERIGVTVILDFRVGGVSKQIVDISARSMQNAELQGERHGL